MAAVEVLTFGETMVSLRSTGPLSQGGQLSMHAAGAESNVVIGLARLGHAVRWVGRVGMDPHGDFIARALRAEAVDVRLGRDALRPTGVMLLEQRTQDVGRAFYYRAGSAGSRISRADIAAALADGARVLHLTGITPALSDAAREVFTHAAEEAAGLGMEVSLDVNFRSKLWSREEAREVLRRVARHATIITASDDELDMVCTGTSGVRALGATVEAMAAGLLESGVREVVVKLGAGGASAWTADGHHHVDAVPVTVIDTVGAGDAFVAGYLSAMLDGEGVPARLQRGALLGAFAVSTAGDWEGLPQRNELGLLQCIGRQGTDR
ncbi:hypothetical protein ART_2461 [Arthrobacter sp. PAMC 25486]|nr:hypothetical protein ART_2461 [Arthrobacter sp. PAMC 25486]